MNNLNDNDL